MKVEQTSLPGVLLIEPRIFADERGFFLESFNERRFAEYGLPTCFRQDNHSRSKLNVLRGLHYQQRKPQGKLVTVISGRIFDVCVDVRPDSSTFGQWHGVVLSADKPQYVWVPPGYAHGLCVLSDVADVLYKCTEPYAPEDERGVLWSDPNLGIEWPIATPVLSRKDQSLAPLLADRSDLPGTR